MCLYLPYTAFLGNAPKLPAAQYLIKIKRG
nr:MAG TPA: hypothetical protein [Caudoviricetes sp.]